MADLRLRLGGQRTQLKESYSFLGSGRMSAYEGKSYAHHNGGDHPYAVREVTGSGYTLTFTYDAAGNMTQRQVRNGSATTAQTLGWDWGNRLRSVTQSGANTETYWYDQAGVRVCKQVGSVETLYPFYETASAWRCGLARRCSPTCTPTRWAAWS